MNSFKLYTKRVLDKLSKAPSMLSLSNSKELKRILSLHAWKLLCVASGKVRVSARLRRFNKFLELILKVYSNHGATFVVKWLKACHIAVQRKLSSKPMSSLRELEKDLPLPRLVNGLPSFIGTMDRKAIRMKHPGTIRLWLTILNIYRVLEAPTVFKPESITNPSKADQTEIKFLVWEIKDIIIFNKFTRPLSALKASSVHRTVASGPNVSNAYRGILTDAWALYKDTEMFRIYCNYALVTKSDSFLLFLRKVMKFTEKALNRFGDSILLRSGSVTTLNDLRLGKLSFKTEAAGKLRTFAMVDIWTQSLLAPLHKDLFKFLRTLPNDGTFDQDASFARCIEKAKVSNCAFAFDLSSATDRLPVIIQAEIINLLYNHGFIGYLWRDLLVHRKYIIRSDDQPEWQGKELTYSTGQPMGALSSWAMLAVTHHFIMQVCNFRVNGTRIWYDNYEVLGDDIVIFDKDIAMEYLALMAKLDVGINLSKSITSESLQTFEFAKRTAVDGSDVSGLSWKQLISGNNDQGRTMFVLSMVLKGLLSTPGLLIKAQLSSRYYSIKDVFRDSHVSNIIGNSLINILGSFSERGMIPLESVVSMIIDPHESEGAYFVPVKGPKLPILLLLRLVPHLVSHKGDSLESFIPNFKKRLEIVSFGSYIPRLAESIYNVTLDRWMVFLASYLDKKLEYARALVPEPHAYLFEIHEEEWRDLQWIASQILKEEEHPLLSYALDAYDTKARSTSGQKWKAGDIIFTPEGEMFNYSLDAVNHYADLVDSLISRTDFLTDDKDLRSSVDLPKLIRSLIDSQKDYIEDQFS